MMSLTIFGESVWSVVRNSGTEFVELVKGSQFEKILLPESGLELVEVFVCEG